MTGLRPALLALAAALATVGCQSEKSPPPTSSPSSTPTVEGKPPKAVWSYGTVRHQLGFEGDKTKLDLYCCLPRPGGPMKVSVRGFHQGADVRVRVGATDWKPASPTATMGTFDADIHDHLAQVRLDSFPTDASAAQLKGTITVPISVKLPRYQRVETDFKAPVRLGTAIFHLFAGVSKGPVTFAGEPQDSKPDAAIALWDKHTLEFTLHRAGKAEMLQDVDWVGVPERVDTGKTKTCRGSGGAPDGGAAGTVDVELFAVRLDVYDRRTGKKLGSKTFPPGDCPSAATAPRGKALALGARRPDMARWLEERVEAGTLE